MLLLDEPVTFSTKLIVTSSQMLMIFSHGGVIRNTLRGMLERILI